MRNLFLMLRRGASIFLICILSPIFFLFFDYYAPFAFAYPIKEKEVKCSLNKNLSIILCSRDKKSIQLSFFNHKKSRPSLLFFLNDINENAKENIDCEELMIKNDSWEDLRFETAFDKNFDKMFFFFKKECAANDYYRTKYEISFGSSVLLKKEENIFQQNNDKSPFVAFNASNTKVFDWFAQAELRKYWRFNNQGDLSGPHYQDFPAKKYEFYLVESKKCENDFPSLLEKRLLTRSDFFSAQKGVLLSFDIKGKIVYLFLSSDIAQEKTKNICLPFLKGFILVKIKEYQAMP